MSTQPVTPNPNGSQPQAPAYWQLILDPSSTPRWIPDSQINDAFKAGGKSAVNIIDPNGVSRWIPADQKDAALQAGGKVGTLADSTQTDPAQVAPAAQKPDLWHRLADPIANSDVVREVAGDAANFLHNATSDNPLASFWYGDTTAGDAIKNPKAGMGSKIIANLMELMTGDEEAKALTSAPAIAAKMQEAGKFLKFLDQYPKIQKALALGLRAGGEIGAQDVAQGKGAGTATEDAAIGSVAAPATSALISGAGNLIRNTVAKVAPRTVEIAGEKIPALASQVDERGVPTGEGAEGAPAIAAVQQKGGAAVVRNTAQDAAQNILDRVNATRGTAGRAAEGAPRLPAPEGSQPFTFELGTTPTEEGTTSDLLQLARKRQVGTAYESRTNPNRFDRETELPKYGINDTEGGTGAEYAPGQEPKPEGETNSRNVRKVPVFKYFTESKPGSVTREDVATGGGNLRTTDPAEAERWRYQLQQIIDSPEFEKLPEARQNEISDAHENLQKQLGLYYQSPYASRMAPLDTAEAVGNVGTFGDAADAVQTSIKPVYETLDRLSNGGFNKWKLQARQAGKIIRNATSADAVDAAQTRLDEANSNIDQIITRHAGQISQGDYRAAKMAWKESVTLNNLHNAMERMANGITTEESERGLPRVVTGNAKLLESWLSKSTNRADTERLIGTEGIDNLKKMSLLLSKAGTARATQSVLKETAMEIERGIRHGAILGGVAGEVAGGHWGAGAGIGGVLGGAHATTRAVLRYAATNPRIGNMVEYAATHGLDPKHYAPLIARAITAGNQPAEPAEETSTMEEQPQ